MTNQKKHKKMSNWWIAAIIVAICFVVVDVSEVYRKK